MITHLRGKLVEKNPTYVVVECSGVGYYAHISLNTFSKLPDDEAVFLYTYLSVKEDSNTLFGFVEKLEREIFKLLISVSGVGPSIARTMLSSMSTTEIQQAIASGDIPTIQSVKGIGAKTAQRVIIDLKDKIIKTYGMDEVSAVRNNTNKEEALTALEVLGFTRKQSEKVID
ncbi:MAG: Holliday junction branch migration protein RuvA, partial [Urechidicola sp.]|nr:Holliday junction branch migration protein RuvA [Urechidicola sp.]